MRCTHYSRYSVKDSQVSSIKVTQNSPKIFLKHTTELTCSGALPVWGLRGPGPPAPWAAINFPALGTEGASPLREALSPANPKCPPGTPPPSAWAKGRRRGTFSRLPVLLGTVTLVQLADYFTACQCSRSIQFWHSSSSAVAFTLNAGFTLSKFLSLHFSPLWTTHSGCFLLKPPSSLVTSVILFSFPVLLSTRDVWRTPWASKDAVIWGRTQDGGRGRRGRMLERTLPRQPVYLGCCSATVTDLTQHNRLVIRRGLHLLGGNNLYTSSQRSWFHQTSSFQEKKGRHPKAITLEHFQIRP